MKALLAILLLLGLTGCAQVTIKREADGSMTVSTFTFLKDIQDASFQTENIVGELGSSSSEETKAMTAICILYPQVPGCQ